MNVTKSYLSFEPKRVTNDKIDDIFDDEKCENNIFKFKSKLTRHFNSVKIAGVCNDVLKSAKLVDGNYEIKFETKNLKYDLTSVKDISIDPNVFILLMKDIFKIELKNEDGYIKCSVPLNSACNFLKPNIPSGERENPITNYLLDIYVSGRDSDVSFKLKDRNINAHSLILKRLPFFQELLEHRREKDYLYPNFENFNFMVVDAYFSYLYGGKLFEDGKILLYTQMIELTNEITLGKGDENLKPLLLKKIRKMIDEKNFVDFIAIEHKDGDLENLSAWVLNKYCGKEKVDFSQSSFSSLCKLYQKKFGMKVEWGGELMAELGKKLELSDAFIDLCNAIIKNRDKNGKTCLVDSMKKNEKLYEQLTKDENYKNHKKAFNVMMKDINLS